MTTYYIVVWDNGHACDEFPEHYASEQDAIDAGNNWRGDMIATDDNPKEAEEAYSFEVFEREQSNDPHEGEQYQTPREMGWVGQDGLP